MAHFPNFAPVTNFKDLRILITNDDGIHAPGLKTLEQIAKSLTDDVWVIAPEHEQSGASHSLTLHRPVRLRKISPHRFALSGTPTDCVLFGVRYLFKNQPKPTLLLSGVNNGNNVADQITYSGTIAGAMEGTLLGIRSIAMSLDVTYNHPPKWATVLHYAPDLLRKLLALPCPQNVLMNINFPDKIPSSVTGIEAVPQAFESIEKEEILECLDPRGHPYYWFGKLNPQEITSSVETDLTLVQKGGISITPLHMDLTHQTTLNHLRGVFSDHFVGAKEM